MRRPFQGESNTEASPAANNVRKMTATRCHSHAVDDFLADRMDESAQRTFERHLDECDQCCEKLNSRTADVTLWNDAREFLSSTDNAELQTSAATTCASSPGADMLRLDFLNPTDDPHMLGRFGGYEISAVIGHGGMGIVLKGFDRALNRYSAIKVLAPHYASSGAARQRFAREAQAAAAVVHDNVVAIHGVSECNGLPYLEMPYIKGESLQKRIDREGALSTAEVLRIALQTARGLAAAHGQGLVHRDVKPGNILLPENVERVLITDFGLARAADDASLTRSGVIAGTPQYMSPEQARGEVVDGRSDLFSLGSVMYSMCTGRPPFRAENAYGILRRITDTEPRPVRDINSDIPQWLCTIIDRLLRKDVASRFASATEVAELLEGCLAHANRPNDVPLPESLATPTGTVQRWKVIAATGIGLLMLFGAWAATEDSESRDTEQQVGSEREPQPTPIEEHEVTLETDLDWEWDTEIDHLEETLQALHTDMNSNMETNPVQQIQPSARDR